MPFKTLSLGWLHFSPSKLACLNFTPTASHLGSIWSTDTTGRRQPTGTSPSRAKLWQILRTHSNFCYLPLPLRDPSSNESSIHLLTPIWRQVSNTFSPAATKGKPRMTSSHWSLEGGNKARGGRTETAIVSFPRPLWLPDLHPGKRDQTEGSLHSHQRTLRQRSRRRGSRRRRLPQPSTARKRGGRSTSLETYPVSSTWRGDKRGSLCGWQRKPSPAPTRWTPSASWWNPISAHGQTVPPPARRARRTRRRMPQRSGGGSSGREPARPRRPGQARELLGRPPPGLSPRLRRQEEPRVTAEEATAAARAFLRLSSRAPPRSE